MNRLITFKIFLVTAAMLMLLAIPQSSFAQRGGFHGGGSAGFHGGGGAGFHGGGGFRGSGFSGFRGRGGFGNFRGSGGFRNGGGFYGRGFYGGYRGYYPGYYSGFGFGFGFWPYWGTYPYGYGYGWWPGPYAYYTPYGYPDDGYSERGGCQADDPCGRDRDHRDCYDYRQKCSSPDRRPDARPDGANPPAKPSSQTGPDGAPGGRYLTVGRLESETVAAYHVSSGDGDGLDIRPAVRNAIAALRAMPPWARERQLQSNRYDAFSPEERGLMARASQPSPREATN